MGIIQDKPIKKSQYRFCKNIFTPQTCGIEGKQKKRNINYIRNIIKDISLKDLLEENLI